MPLIDEVDAWPSPPSESQQQLQNANKVQADDHAALLKMNDNLHARERACAISEQESLAMEDKFLKMQKDLANAQEASNVMAIKEAEAIKQMEEASRQEKATAGEMEALQHANRTGLG